MGYPRKSDLHIGAPVQFESCFISQSTKDGTFCDKLYEDLQNSGVRCWYFPYDATWGQPAWGEIDRAIWHYDRLIVICSKNALTSGSVLREVDRALQRENVEGLNILFPIILDDYLFDQWEHERKADVVAKVVGNFRGWELSDENYQEGFQRLLKGLREEAEE